jgi:putative oxidoreductase
MSMTAAQQSDEKIVAEPVPPEVRTGWPESRFAWVEALLERITVPALRASLGLVFVWFGALKVLNRSPVADLVGATVPWIDPHLLLPALGWVEVVLGLALLAGRPRRLALVAVALHLSGTFLTFVDAPSMVITGGNPLLLTGNGEFVLKNLVLIFAALVLLARTKPRA